MLPIRFSITACMTPLLNVMAVDRLGNDPDKVLTGLRAVACVSMDGGGGSANGASGGEEEIDVVDVIKPHLLGIMDYMSQRLFDWDGAGRGASFSTPKKTVLTSLDELLKVSRLVG